MRDFFIFLLILILSFIFISNSHIAQKTRSGARLEYFQSIDSRVLTPVLSRYLNENGIHYRVYKIPNYVDDFLKYEQYFSHLYRSSKCMVVIFPQDKLKYSSFNRILERLFDLLKENRRYFNVICRDEKENPHYVLDYDSYAYKNFREYCNGFCIIDTRNKIMFSFLTFSDNNVQALDVIFQEYKYLYKSK